MATLYSTQATIINNMALGASPAPIDVTDLGGRVRSAFFSYTTVGTEAVSDVIRLTKLPKGARVIGFNACAEDIGAATCVLAIGDADDVDRLVTGLVVSAALAPNAASTILRTPTTEIVDIGFGYKYTAETWINATVTTAAIDAVGQLWGVIQYVVD